MATRVQERPAYVRVGLLLTFLLSILLLGQVASADITTLATGMLTPESISIAPSGFGEYEGDYFIPDAGRVTIEDSGSVWRVSPDGSTSQFAAGMGDGLPNHPLGGLFLPSGWGGVSGQLLVAGYTESTYSGDGKQYSRLTAFDSSGASTQLLSYLHEGGASTLTSPIIAPDDFGDHGGDLIVTDQQGNLLWVRPNEAGTGYDSGELVDFVNELHNGFNPFGITIAGDGFGGVGGKLLVSEVSLEPGLSGPRIMAVDSLGNTTEFATINLYNGQMRLRQITMAPAGFLSDIGIEGQVLLVSVTASQYGGGLGTLIAVDGTGSVVAYLKSGTELDKLDPRGMLIRDDWSLLVSDASDPIIIAEIEDFAPGEPPVVPEPASLVALAAGLVGVVGMSQRVRRRS